MGLTVKVIRPVGDKKEKEDDTTTSFDIGYMGYGNFRMHVVDVLCGKQYGNVYRAKFMMRMGPFRNMTPQMARVVSPDLFKQFNLSRKPYPSSKLTAEDQATLNFFLEHSDTDGEFSHSQCQKLAALFTKYARKMKDADRRTYEVFESFTKVFQAAATSGGNVCYC